MNPETRDAILTLSRRMDALADELRGTVANDAEVRDVREVQLRAATEYTRELEAHLGIAFRLLGEARGITQDEAATLIGGTYEVNQHVSTGGNAA